jgi:hypothetical protein
MEENYRGLISDNLAVPFGFEENTRKLSQDTKHPRRYFKPLLSKYLPFNARIKSLRATLPDEIFTGDFAS